MTLEQFAAKYKLRVQRTTPLRIPEGLGKYPFHKEDYASIPGRWGWIHGPFTNKYTEFHIVFQSEHPATVHRWRAAKRACAAVGITLATSGDYEGILYFDPANNLQGETAIRVIQGRRKKQYTEEQKMAMRRSLDAAREKKMQMA